ncbi:MAG: PIN domain-containing protein [Rubritalea sp.]|uniref:PIN domain-containing protein n=1 Tax=Rubritalea sp. TaxID=2109375 RepID=UPI003241CC1D
MRILRDTHFVLPMNCEYEVTRLLLDNQIHQLGIQANYCAAIVDLPLHHRDPFDRMLIAIAQCENLTTVSRDSAFQEHHFKILW